MNLRSRTENAGKNLAAAMVNKIVMILLTFISRKIFIEYIGVEYLGINGLFSNVLTLLSLADLGLSTAINVSLYQPIAENNTSKLAALVNYYKKLYRIIAIAVTIAGLSMLPFLKYIINTETQIPNIELFYLVYLSNTVVSYLCIYKSSIINADQKNYIVNKISMYSSSLKVILQILLIIVCKSYLLYILMEVVSTAVNNLFVSYLADRMYPFIREPKELESGEKKEIFRNVYSVFLYKISYAIFVGTDNIIMSLLVGTMAVGLFSNYCTITNLFDSTVNIIFASVIAGIGNLVAVKGAREGLRTFQVMQMTAFWIATVEVVGLFYLMQDFIVLWLGENYLLNLGTAAAIIINLYLSIIMRPVWSYREGTGMYSQIRYIMLAGAVLNVFLSFWLGRRYGVAGIILATAVAKLATYFWYEPQILFQRFFETGSQWYFREILYNVMLTLGILVVLLPLGRLRTGSNIVLWLLKGLICMAAANMALFIRYRRSREWKQLTDRLKSLRKR